jgi:hypothetical protein
MKPGGPSANVRTGPAGETPHETHIAACLSSGTVGQQVEKVIAYLARRDGWEPLGAIVAEQVERLVMYDRPTVDPRATNA